MDKSREKEDILIEESLTSAYMAYALAVNLGRAIPDLRDGFKPVQRRVILGLVNLTGGSDKFVKSARVVGEVMGKYHPHGDSSIYEAAISMSTDWGNRLPLVLPQGNNGSISGDNPAAMRYTEMRLSRFININKHLLANSGLPTAPTYDGSGVEYTLFPTDIPYVLINGTRGIGVSISSYIPPFNPREIAKASQYILERWVKGKKPTHKGIAKRVKGPDFPTGGIVSSPNWTTLLETGRGNITHEAEIEYEGKTLHILSVPSETSVTNLVKSINNNASLLGITDMADLTDGGGVSIKLVFKKPVTEDTVERLYRNTLCRVNKAVKMVVCYRDSVKRMSVLEILEKWLKNKDVNMLSYIVKEHGVLLETIDRLSLMIYIAENIDTIIDIIKASGDNEDAINNLVNKLGVTIYDAEKIVMVKFKHVRSLDIKVRKAEIKALRREVDALEDKMVNNEKRYKDIMDAMFKIIEGADGRMSKVVDFTTKVPEGITLAMHIDTSSISSRPARETDVNKGANRLLPSTTHILIITSEGVVYRINSNVITETPSSPMKYITPRERNVHIVYVGVYKPNMYVRITMYNTKVEAVLHPTLTVGRRGNKLFDLPTRVKSVKVKYV